MESTETAVNWLTDPPAEWEPCLCSVLGKDSAWFDVLYHHPRKGWCYREGLELTPSAKVVQYAPVRMLSRMPLETEPPDDL